MVDKKIIYVEPDDYIPKDLYDKYFRDDEDSDCGVDSDQNSKRGEKTIDEGSHYGG